MSTHPVFEAHQPPDRAILAWRYMDMPKLLSLIVNRELNLRRLDLMPDKFEGLYPTRVASELARAYSGSGQLDANMALKLANHQTLFAREVKKSLYINCWHLGFLESEAMWRIYCGGGGGVAIVLTYEQLSASIDSGKNQAWLGIVKYLDYDRELLLPGNVFVPALHKRIQFKHEDEARIVKLWADPAATAPGQEPNSVSIPWDLSVIEKIIVSPYVSSWYADTVRSVVDRLAPGLSPKVSQSLMAAEPT